MNEERRSFKLRKMGGTQLLRLARRVQRIGEQQEPVGESRIFRSQHTGLPAAIRDAAEPELAWMLFPEFQQFRLQACAVALGVGRARRTRRALLPENQIVPDDGDLMFGECIGERHQQRRIPIPSGAVREQ